MPHGKGYFLPGLCNGYSGGAHHGVNGILFYGEAVAVVGYGIVDAHKSVGTGGKPHRTIGVGGKYAARNVSCHRLVGACKALVGAVYGINAIVPIADGGAGLGVRAARVSGSMVSSATSPLPKSISWG